MYKLHIPVAQYGFVECEIDNIEDIHTEYSSVMARFGLKMPTIESNGGLSAKDWNEALDTYISQNTLHSETYANMSQDQKNIIQEIKRSVKRIEYKNN
jgi:hypothetical protein